MNDEAIAEKLIRRHNDAKALRSPWEGVWRELAQYCKPERSVIGHKNGYQPAPDMTRFDLFDGTALSGNLIFGSGCMSYLTPSDMPWFRFDAPQRLNDVETVKGWLAEVTEITQYAIAQSNFYSQIHEAYLEKGAFGTMSVFVEPSDRNPLRFVSREIGDFSLLENADGEIDTWFHEITMTARQAAEKFAAPGDRLPAEIAKCIETGGNEADKKFEFLHVIYPRTDAERDSLKIDGPNMPWASVYLFPKTREIVRKSGFWEQPEATGRYLKWGQGVFGIAPALFGLADQRQLNHLQMNLDVLAEVAAFPRIRAHADLEGELDLRASGVTYYNDPNKKAEAWLTEGRYDIGQDRVQMRREAVRAAFHVDLFQMFAGIPMNREMTATEVAERRRDKLTLFSPMFSRVTTEVLNPLLRRVFGILLRAGYYPEVPRELVAQTSPGQAVILDPEIVYTSRIALELKAIQTAGFQRALGSFAPLFQVNPGLLDNVDLDRAFRDTLRNENAPEDWLAKEDAMRQVREARAQAEAEQAQKLEAMQGAEMAAKMAQSGALEGLAA